MTSPPPDNPFLQPSPLPYGLPPFAAITVEHLRPALEEGMRRQLAEVAAITADPEPPTFGNTVVALERSGRVLSRVSRVFALRNGSDTTPELQELAAEMSPRLAAHSDTILLDSGLFARVDALHRRRAELGLAPEASRLLDRHHLDFVRAGAALDPAQQDRLRALNAELAALSTEFGTRLLADTNEAALHVTDVAELAGLPADALATAAAAAHERGLPGHLIDLVLPTHQPALVSLRNPAIRRRLLDASLARGARGNTHDTRGVVARIVVLRAERAALLGYRSHSDYVLADRTAGSNEAVEEMLRRLIPPAVANAEREAAELTALMARDNPGAVFGAADWAFYADRLRRDRYAFDTAALRPYCELRRTLHEGVFFAAERLYGLTFTRRFDLVGAHPEALVYEVFDGDGTGIGLFIGDYLTRDSKRGGAWCEALVSQSHLLDQRPVVVNTMNIPKPAPGRPALLTLDEVGTMFHEFGHALHGLLSDVTFPRLAGTAVARDFVEYPSQVNELWMTDAEVMSRYLRHVETGEPAPAELTEKLTATANLDQGFATVAYLAATWIDLAWHRLAPAETAAAVSDVEAFERSALAQVGLNLATVPPRYRTPYFNHVFGGGYSAGYYAYIWSEILDAATVEWFEAFPGTVREAGRIFRERLLSRGGTAPELSYVADVLGGPAPIEPLLRRRGLLGPAQP